MAEPWKRYLLFVGGNLLVLLLIYIFAKLVLFKIVLTSLVVFIWPFYAIYTYLLVKKEKENEISNRQ